MTDETGKRKRSGGHHTLLQKHESTLVELIDHGLKPKEIAEMLCTANLLPTGSITPQQVSDWISYHKKNKRLNTPSVTSKTNKVEWADNCLFFCFSNLTNF